ncbi:deoxyguanosinetriphosphate triphosphohydrolase [Desulfothermobacter acidiphilus]|uniref:deoxyguanosinetriphosphate triphosphohydrolase n=1 Tax=Desulfothermobacter acidiphilus TaxID=1938353 RepID=UPI003F8CAEE0
MSLGRTYWEELEEKILSPHACLSRRTRGRQLPEEPCSVRTEFQRDRDRIIHSKSFRRLKYKTQVFLIPEGDHYRTRLTHTLEVTQIARTIARGLRLNEDLTEAIALGHDLGHTPFGHTGEQALAEVFPGFRHNEQSLRVVDLLEKGTGLNLTFEVRDGILNHTGPNSPATLEGQIVRLADRIAYINHDIDDALRGGVLVPEDLPGDCVEFLGHRHSQRINTMVLDIIQESRDRPEIRMSEPVRQAITRLREFLFERVYLGSAAKREEGKARHVVQFLFHYFVKHPQHLPREYLQRVEEFGLERVVADYIAGMTDRYAVTQFANLCLPRGFSVF